MRGVNKVTIIGNLGADPEIRFMPSGIAVANISLATTRAWKDKQTGEAKEKTEWHRVVLFKRTAEVAGEYLKKGSPVYIEGRLQTRKWQTQDGQDRWTTEIVATDMQMLGGRSDAGNGNGNGRPQKSGGGQSPHPSSNNRPPAPPADDFDDDIPF